METVDILALVLGCRGNHLSPDASVLYVLLDSSMIFCRLKELENICIWENQYLLENQLFLLLFFLNSLFFLLSFFWTDSVKSTTSPIKCFIWMCDRNNNGGNYIFRYFAIKWWTPWFANTNFIDKLLFMLNAHNIFLCFLHYFNIITAWLAVILCKKYSVDNRWYLPWLFSLHLYHILSQIY